jgi:hypothetical protein
LKSRYIHTHIPTRRSLGRFKPACRVVRSGTLLRYLSLLRRVVRSGTLLRYLSLLRRVVRSGTLLRYLHF